MPMLFRSITTILICSLCLLILTSSGINLVTSLFLVPSVLNTLNKISASFVLILSFVDLYSCLTEIITTFYFLNISGAAIDRYPSIVLIMSACTFFFNKKMVCNSSISAFIANTLNSIMKSTIYFFFCLKILIFHSVSTILLLLLNIVLISHKNLSQS